MANRMYFYDNAFQIARAYDFSGAAQTSDNISTSQSGSGIFVLGDRFYVVVGTDSNIKAFDFSGTAQTSDDQNLQTIIGSTYSPRGATVTDNRIVLVDSSGEVKFLNHSWVYQSTEDISLGTGDWRGVVASNDRLYFVNDTTDTAVAYDFSRTAQSTDNISLGTGVWQGGARSNNRLYFINTSTIGKKAVAYNFSGVIQDGNSGTTDESIALASTGTWRGGATRFTDANLTIATTDTNLHTGKVVNFNIGSDIDISDFAASDITVTGGTRGALTMTDARNFVLSVTLGAVGNLNIAIGEDAVSPGNAAVDADFTIVARATVAIAFDDDDMETGDSADATVTFSEDPEGLTVSDFSVNAGTVDSISGSGTTRTVTVTAPSSGTGTITLTLAADSIDQGNAEASDTIDYAPPSETLTVAIAGTTNIEQGETTALTATVTGEDGNAAVGALTYAWTASRGSFVGSTTGASVTYEADFTDSSDVDVDITCTVTRTADASPTVSTGSLTAMTALGITGQILNMYITETEASSNGSNKVIYAAGSDDSALSDGSDDDITNAINTWRVQYHPSNDWLILNNDGSGDLNAFFENNTTQSVYLIFSDGEYYEITNAQYDNGGAAWCRWDVTAISALATKLDAIGADDTLLVGVGNAGSVGYIAGSGSGTTQVTATASTAATATISTTDTDIRAGETFDVDIVFSESVTGFAVGDITVTGGTKGALTGSGTDYTLSVTAGSAGTLTVSIAADVVTEGNAAASEDFTVNALPTVTITTTESVIQTGEEFTVTLQWSEAVSGFATGDISVTNATKGIFTTVDGDTYTLVLTASNTPSTIEVTVAANAVTVGNAETAESFTSTDLPTVSITTTDTDIRVGEAFTVTFQWSENVTGFATGDVSVTGATKGTFTAVDGDTYTLVLTASDTAGTITVTVAANAITQENVETSQNFTSNALPTVTITSSDSDIRVGEAFTVTFQWSETVSGFATGDVTVTGATKGTFTAVDGDTYTLALTASTTAGNIVVTVAGDAVSLGNAETAETFTNSALPTVDMTFSVSRVNNGSDVTVTFQWSESVSGFVTGDVTISAGTKGTFTAVDGDTYTLVVTAPNTGDGDIEITVAQNSVTLGNAEYSESIGYGPASTFAITQVGPVVITVGAMNYDLPVPISGTTANTTVTQVGDWEGFYMDWDQPNGMLHIRSEEVTRLVGEYVWLLTVEEGENSITGEIVYSVVPEAPVITPITDTQPIFRGVRNKKSVEITNNADTASIEGLQVGMKHEATETGLDALGGLPTDARLTETTFMGKVIAENATARVESMVPFEVLNEPQMWIGETGNATQMPPNPNIHRLDANTANNTTPPIFSFSTPESEHGIGDFIVGMYVDGDDVNILRRSGLNADTFFAEVARFDKDVEEGGIADPITIFTIAETLIGNPQGLCKVVTSSFAGFGDVYIVNATTRRVGLYQFQTNGTLTLHGSQYLGGALPSSYSKIRGIHVDASNDAYLVDLATRRVIVLDEINETTGITGTSPSIERWFGLPTGNDAPGDIFVDDNYVYVVDFRDANEDEQFVGEASESKVYVMDKNTAHGTTATATRVINLPKTPAQPIEIAYPQAIYIDS